MIKAPPLKLYVQEKYLTGDGVKFVPAYLVGLDCRPGDFIRFSVLLESGALWSGLPIEAMFCDYWCPPYAGNAELSTSDLQPYTCLEGPVSIMENELLYGATCEAFGTGELCVWLFVVNYQGRGLASDPEQYKTHNILVSLESGRLLALPNNHFKFLNNWFVQSEKHDVNKYRRSAVRYEAGE